MVNDESTTLNALIKHFRSMRALGIALHEISGGVLSEEPPSPFRIHAWKARGIAPAWRYWIVRLARKEGLHVDEDAVMRGVA